MPAAALSRRVRVLVVVLVVQLATATTAVVRLQPDGAQRGQQTTARAVVNVGPTALRAKAVGALLDRRAMAVLGRNRSAFLATMDPAAVAFRARQTGVFAALAAVPLAAWDYVITDEAQPDDPALDREYGTWWAPTVELRYALKDIDDAPSVLVLHPTFVRRGEQWLLAADDDFAAGGKPSAHGIWDGGTVIVTRGKRSLVLGHPGSEAEMRRLALEADAAVPRVTAAVGTSWSQTVAVILPDNGKEMDQLVDTGASLSSIAALAVGGPGPGGDRVYVNPDNVADLGPVARRVVLTHEVTHVATRKDTGPSTPLWLSEGLADHVGFLGAGIDVSRAAAESLQVRVRAGNVPAALPSDEDFSGNNADLALSYEGAWLAYELLVTTYGGKGALAGYRRVGAGASFDRAFGTSTAAFTASWRAALRAELG